MATNNERDSHYEKKDHTNDISPPEDGHSKDSQVLETMRHLIVEIHIFKKDNEQLKKFQEK